MADALFGLSAVPCFLLAAIGFLKPSIVLPSRLKPSRLKAGAIYFALGLVLIGVSASEEQRKMRDPAYIAKQKADAATAQKDAERQDAERQAAYISISASGLYNGFQQNALAMKKRYGQKLLLIGCRVDSVGEEITGKPYVACRTENEFMPVHLVFGNDQNDALAELRSGQWARAECSGADMIAGFVTAECTGLREAPKAPASN